MLQESTQLENYFSTFVLDSIFLDAIQCMYVHVNNDVHLPYSEFYVTDTVLKMTILYYNMSNVIYIPPNVQGVPKTLE